MYSLLTGAKRFDDRWVGHPALNRLGLHAARLLGARGTYRLRARLAGRSEVRRALHEEGVHVGRDLLDPEAFDALRREVRAAVAALPPPPPATDRGFGPSRPHPAGFDRYDGTTLNRFVRVDASLPRARAVARTIAGIGARTSGARRHPEKLWIQQLVHGPEDDNPDIQKVLHRDTFHPAIKLWYFLDDVRPGEGEFVYVPGSHRLDRRRLAWELEQAGGACRPGSAQVHGSFRIHQDDLAALGLPSPRRFAVPRNTLVVANIFGFHARGSASVGARRLAIHGSFRPSPFVPIPY